MMEETWGRGVWETRTMGSGGSRLARDADISARRRTK